MEPFIIAISILLLFILLLFILLKNRKDRQKLEEQMNRDYNHPSNRRGEPGDVK